MSSSQSAASQDALETNRQLATSYYGLALPALGQRQDSINMALAGGESPMMSQAFQAQRTGLTEGLTANAGAQRSAQMAASKSQLSGGNMSSMLSTGDMGAQLANALYGSKFTEGQADINQKMNLMSMALGGAGTTGNAALTSAGQQLGAIQYLPNYNQTYANVVGGASALGSLYGAYNQWKAGQPPPGSGGTGGTWTGGGGAP